MPDEHLEPRAPQPPIPAALPQLYTNTVLMRGGAFEITFDLGFAVPAESPDQAPQPPQWLARVSMSWEHAVAFNRFLAKAIHEYQERVGQLPDVEKLRVGEQQ
jgi:hypothetical protein